MRDWSWVSDDDQRAVIFVNKFVIRASLRFICGSQDHAWKRCNAVRADTIMSLKEFRFTLGALTNTHDI